MPTVCTALRPMLTSLAVRVPLGASNADARIETVTTIRIIVSYTIRFQWFNSRDATADWLDRPYIANPSLGTFPRVPQFRLGLLPKAPHHQLAGFPMFGLRF